MTPGVVSSFLQDTIKVGGIGEMSGPFGEFGKSMETGIIVYQKLHGDSVAGSRVEVICKIVGARSPELVRRLVQELDACVNWFAGNGYAHLLNLTHLRALS